MTDLLLSYCDLLNQAARVSFSELAAAPEFVARIYPSVDLEHGDLASDCCMSIAARLRRTPAEIADAIVPKLAGKFAGELSYAEGFLNIRLTDPFAIAQSPPDLSQTPPRHIILPPPSKELNGWAHLRLVAAAAIQAGELQRLGGTPQLWLGDRKLASFESLDFISELAAAQVAQSYTSRDKAAVIIKSVIGNLSETENVTLWLSTRSLEQGDFREIYRDAIKPRRASQALAVEREWLTPIESDLQLKSLTTWAIHEIRALYYYLAGPTSAGDLDIHVARLAERDNLIWYARTLAQRLSLINSNAGQGGQTLPADLTLRRLALRDKFLPYFARRAAEEGGVQDFMAVLLDMLNLASRLFNSPQFRRRAAAGEITRYEWEIMTGVGHKFSDIMMI